MTSNPKYKVLFTIFLFLYIYTPPILSINILHFLAVLSYIILILKFRHKFLDYLKRVNIFLFIIGIFLSQMVLVVTLYFTTKDFLKMYQIIVIVLEVLPISILFIFLFEKYRYDLKDIIHVLLNVAVIQSIIAIIMFLIPSFKEFIIDTFYVHYTTGTGSYLSMSYWTLYRVFGFSTGMMFAMPVVQGFMAAVAFAFTIKKSLAYSLYILPLLFSAAINARTGLLVFVVCCIIILILNSRRFKVTEVIKLSIFIMLIIQILPVAYHYIENRSEGTAKWIQDGVYETKKMLSGESVGYYKSVNNMFFLPETNELIVGTGTDNFGREGSQSDIGYVNDLFLGGIIFTLLLYLSFLILMISGLKRQWEYETLIILMIVTILLVNIKGFAFRQNEFVNLFVLLSVTLYYFKLKKKTSIPIN